MPTQTQPIFALEHVTISYSNSYSNCEQTRTVLKDISFSLEKGQKIGLYAPNGSGKTSLLRCITGLLPKESGIIRFHGTPVTTENDFKALRRAVGFVLQEAQDQIFFPTVLEDVAFGPLNLGLSSEEAEERALETLNTLAISSLKDRLTHQLSGGEKRLVALAGILAMQPEALLLDEPTTALDTAANQRLLSIVQELDTASVTVCHDLLFLSKVASELYTIRDASLVPMENAVLHTHEHAHFGGEVAHQHNCVYHLP